MAATSGSLFDKHSDRIEEVINKNIEVFLPSLDPVWRDTVVSAQGVGPADAIGRDMKILKVYMGSMAGVLEQGAPRADVGLYGDDTDNVGSKLYLQNLAQTWPDPLNGPNAAPYRLGIPMRSMMSNIMFTLGELQAEAVPAFIGEVVAPKLEGFAKNIAHTLCNYWYVNQNDFYKLGTISAIIDADDGASLDASSTRARCTITEGTYDRFYVGQAIDIVKSDGDFRKNDSGADGSQTTATRIKVFVDAVDELKGYVYLKSDTTAFNGGGASAHDTIANDILVYANSADFTVGAGANIAPTGIAGINSWLKSGDTGANNTKYLLGDERDTSNQIDLSIHPEFKSFTKSSVGTLTEHKLRQYLRRFHSAKNKYGQYIDCLIASDGVWMAYEATKIGREILDRTGRLSSLSSEGSNEGFQFAFDGRSYTGYTSTYVEDGSVYGIRKGGSNWKRYVPPTPSGYSKFDRAESFIPFNFIAGALTGTGTNKLPIYDSSASGNRSMVTEGVQMPGLLRMQLVPDQPAGMKLTGVTTDNVYSDV
jgi:hypothetical protein